MKYAILDDFKAFLQRKYRSKATVKQYRFWVAKLLETQFFMELNGIDFEGMLKELETCTKNRNEYSQAKNAVLNFAEFSQRQIEIPQLEKPKKRRYRKQKQRKLKDINHKINVISDEKLLLSYKVMLSTGLRVGELASIKKQDIEIHENGDYILWFVPKRGGIDKVAISSDKHYLCEGIAELIRTQENNNKIFYSVGYLQSNAKKRGFSCHDLRRFFAKITYRENGGKLRITSEKMRHSNPRTTKLYLKSKVEV